MRNISDLINEYNYQRGVIARIMKSPCMHTNDKLLQIAVVKQMLKTYLLEYCNEIEEEQLSILKTEKQIKQFYRLCEKFNLDDFFFQIPK